MVQLHRIETDGLAQLSFVAAADNGDALVIDPRRDVEVFLDLAEAHDLTLRYVVDTHLHADDASAAPELAQRNGARLLLRGITHGGGAATDANAAEPLATHGGVLKLGGLRITALHMHTPGHTPDASCCTTPTTPTPPRCCSPAAPCSSAASVARTPPGHDGAAYPSGGADGRHRTCA